MDKGALLSVIDHQISRLTQARELLAGGQIGVTKTPKGRALSAEGRKRIADAQKKRWAAKRKEATKK